MRLMPFWSTSMAGDSRLQLSTTVKTRIVRPLSSVSLTKSIDQRWFGSVAGARRSRGACARRLRRFRRTARPSSW